MKTTKGEQVDFSFLTKFLSGPAALEFGITFTYSVTLVMSILVLLLVNQVTKRFFQCPIKELGSILLFSLSASAGKSLPVFYSSEEREEFESL